MDTIVTLLKDLAYPIYPWMNQVATAIVACLMLVFAPDINRTLRRWVGARSFFVRTLLFILVNAFVYGLLIVGLSPWLARQLVQVPPLWLLALLCGLFVFIGVWAQRQRQI
ncbi:MULTISPECIES: DUF3392 domain-containing protein [Shewanella]|uniref:DUF3392 domain-containing protein n=2 Tax=Shewanella TaxID=22 RepID=A0A975AJN4_9GAMM|nr:MULTISPECIES: DUF3392 domain-containing protein [Shewanella]QSX29487.1 DUF3392 domain-containing protein [Shewanella cyperi]QSX36654.1 DUF3392 domain-containing protein [Shewanella sedimentimangrovi]QSX40263.1 DUF3392 domain-containing protein [Shewanella cyperi]